MKNEIVQIVGWAIIGLLLVGGELVYFNYRFSALQRERDMIMALQQINDQQRAMIINAGKVASENTSNLVNRNK